MRVNHAGDSLDLDSLNDLAAHPGYALLVERQVKRREQLTQDLVNAKTWDEVRHLQGRLSDLALTLELPKIIAAEIRAREKKGHAQPG